MPQQFTIVCLASLRDDFDGFCNQLATPQEQRRVTQAFEDFHGLLSGGTGANPPIRYVADPPTLANARDIEVSTEGLRYCLEVDFVNRVIALNCIDIRPSPV